MERYIAALMMVFMAIGAADKIFFRGRLGLASEFEHGFYSVGALILSMAGIMCAAPVAGRFLAAAAGPLFRVLGADPAMAAGALFAIDMGGFPLTVSMTEDSSVQILGGAVLGSMMGATLVFFIPFAMTVCRPEDREPLCKGLVLGLVMLPAGMAAGALTAGIPFSVWGRNMIPICLFCALLAFCLLCWRDQTLRCFQALGRAVQAIGALTLLAASLEAVLGIVFIPGMAPLGEQLGTIGLIGVTLAGAYPLLAVVNRLLAPALSAVGGRLGINEAAVSGMVAALANPIPLLEQMERMDERGKVMAVAFCVPAMAVFGDHLGYINTVMPEAALPMIAAKLTAGAGALLLAGFYMRKP